MLPLALLAQAFGAYSIAQLLIALIVIGALVYVFNTVFEPSPKIRAIVNVVLVAVVAIVAVKVLLSLL